MRTFIYLCILLLPALPLSLKAQNAAEITKDADNLLAAGKIGEAAEMYELAGRLDGTHS